MHPIVLSAIYNDLPVRARSEGHGRAARLLHARGAAPEEVASQLALTAPRGDEWVVEALRAAAARALSLGDPVAAAAHLERALAEPPPDRRRGLRRARARRGAVRRAGGGRSTSARRCGWPTSAPSAGAWRSGWRAA